MEMIAFILVGVTVPVMIFGGIAVHLKRKKEANQFFNDARLY